MKRYRFHWRDGKTEDGEGTSPADALNRLGYGGGSVAALDYWEPLNGGESIEKYSCRGCSRTFSVDRKDGDTRAVKYCPFCNCSTLIRVEEA